MRLLTFGSASYLFFCEVLKFRLKPNIFYPLSGLVCRCVRLRMSAWTDLFMMALTFVFTVLWSVEVGIVVSVSVSLILIVRRSSRPHIQILVRSRSIYLRATLLSAYHSIRGIDCVSNMCHVGPCAGDGPLETCQRFRRLGRATCYSR